MSSDVNVLRVDNNTIGSVGSARIAVGSAMPGSPPTARILVVPRGGAGDQEHLVRLGETFPVVDETWRFADIDFKTLGWWTVTLRRVDGDEPQDPPGGQHGVYEWPRSDEPARLLPYDSLTPARLAELQTALGQDLPPIYARWLAETNGVRVEGTHRIPDLLAGEGPVGGKHYPQPVTLWPHKALFGVDPDNRYRDLVVAQSVHRDQQVSRAYLAIGTAEEGVLFVKAAEPDADSVWLLLNHRRYGPNGEAGHAIREAELTRVGPDIRSFLGRFHPVPEPDIEARPGDVTYPDRNDPMYWAPRE
ncbi:DUF6406 domain-containing protein [Plantactinospora siamensis]|uniref:DUF6406 domain-containing protein n=1 Tax=Plantactinospora siamensis TaxID=555372 RepID=A0ABV6NQ10_9ACTN